MAQQKFRNAYLRGWFAARARRAPPRLENTEEKFFADNGFQAGQQSGGGALPTLLARRAAPAARKNLDSDLTAASAPAPRSPPRRTQPPASVAEPQAILTPEAEAQLHGSSGSALDTDDEDAPRKNVFLPQRAPGATRMRAGSRRFKRG